MRVLLLGPYPPPHGGVQTNVAAIGEYLRERGAGCAVINLTRFRQARGEEVYHPRSALGVLWLLWRLDYDIVHLHLGGDLTRRLLALGLVCGLLRRAKAVVTFHSGGYASSEAGRSARRRSLRGFVFRRFDRVIGVNEQIAEMFRRLGVRRERLRLIGPHAPCRAAGVARLTPAMQAFFDAHGPVLATVGLLEPEYDLPLQIEALGRVRERFPRAGLVIIGWGSLEGELRELIGSKTYGEHVLLCGDVPREVTLRAVAASAVLLRTTRYDGDSVAVREALELGTPVIATDNGMRPPGVDLAPVGELEALCTALEQRLAEGGRREPRPQHGEANLEAVFRLYQELMEE